MRFKNVKSTGLTRQLIQLAIPIVLSNLAYTLLGATDTFFMGRVSTTSLGAVGLANMMFLTPSLILRGTINGAMPFVSRMYGAGDKPAGGRYLQYFLILALLISPAAFLLPWAFKGFLWLFKPEPEVARQILLFTTIRLWEIPFSLTSTAFVSFMIGIGNTRTPMLLSWFAVTINIVANYILIFGKFGAPALGIAGSALGTVIAVTLQAITAGIVVYSRYREEYALTSWHFPTFTDLARMLRVGFPMGMVDFVEVAAFTSFFALISKLGTVELAASQIANQVTALAFMPGFALGAATSSLVGRYIGASDLRLAEGVGYRGARVGVGFMGLVGLIFWFFPDVLAGLFTSAPEVLRLARLLLRMMAVYQVFDALNIVFRGALNGGGDTRFTMMVTFVGSWGVFIPGVYLGAFVLGWGVIGAWLGAITYIIALGIVFSLRFRSGGWKAIEI
ncbi:MAG: MATE family efflux transporter [Syntrophothermus sp.]